MIRQGRLCMSPLVPPSIRVHNPLSLHKHARRMVVPRFFGRGRKIYQSNSSSSMLCIAAHGNLFCVWRLEERCGGRSPIFARTTIFVGSVWGASHSNNLFWAVDRLEQRAWTNDQSSCRPGHLLLAPPQPPSSRLRRKCLLRNKSKVVRPSL